MNPEQWIDLWGVVLVVGLGAYYAVAAVVIPLGARDVRRLFRRLEEQYATADEENAT